MEKTDERKLKPIDYIIGTKDGRCCALKTADDKDFYKAERIKVAVGEELDQLLFYRRAVLGKGQTKPEDICKEKKCKECELLKDFDNRFRTIEMKSVKIENDKIYAAQ